MKGFVVLAGILACLACSAEAQNAVPASYFPKTEIGQFLADHFDLATIRSSFGPRRTPAQRTFSSFGLKPTKSGADFVEFERPEWFYGLKIVSRRDINGDGIEDLAVCFTDHALGGATYSNTQSLLITRYSANGMAVALSYSVDACAEAANK